MVDEAMSNRPHKIDGREVDSKRAVPRDVSCSHYESEAILKARVFKVVAHFKIICLYFQESGRSDTNVNVKKMFVGGLKDQSEADLREYFGKYGTIVAINVVMDKDTGKRKGYGFIEFTDYDPVDKALCKYKVIV
jgi:heterogeneous nuclear ribonucleoprotein A1/A3